MSYEWIVSSGKLLDESKIYYSILKMISIPFKTSAKTFAIWEKFIEFSSLFIPQQNKKAPKIPSQVLFED
jgi:hypothetical protein